MTDKTFYFNKGAPEMPGKTLEERTKEDIAKHISEVKRIMYAIGSNVKQRGRDHDLSKYDPEEFPSLMKIKEYTEKNGYKKFNSGDYEKIREMNKPFLDHHYKNNAHHPEHFENGMKGMDLVDLMEWITDCHVAASQREGSKPDLDKCQERFGFSDDLKQIFQNTLDHCMTGEYVRFIGLNNKGNKEKK